jgi:hypothetical protein
MSSPRVARVAVVVASTGARATVRASLGRFRDETRGRGEVILVDASTDGTADAAERLFPKIRVLRRSPGQLVPELWRDGLNATEAPLVAFSTAAMVPRAGWLTALLDRLEATGAAGVGGSIRPAAGLSVWDRAVYLHRHARYLAPRNAPRPNKPAGENALYRREALLALQPSPAHPPRSDSLRPGGEEPEWEGTGPTAPASPLYPNPSPQGGKENEFPAARGKRGPSGQPEEGRVWEHGFWEVEIHRRLRARGEQLVLAPEAVVAYAGGASLGPTLRQRWTHARRYGASRARAWNLLTRCARVASAPLVPTVLLSRILKQLRYQGEPIGPWLPSLPALALLLATWALGEAVGTARGEPAARPTSPKGHAKLGGEPCRDSPGRSQPGLPGRFAVSPTDVGPTQFRRATSNGPISFYKFYDYILI